MENTNPFNVTVSRGNLEDIEFSTPPEDKEKEVENVQPETVEKDVEDSQTDNPSLEDDVQPIVDGEDNPDVEVEDEADDDIPLKVNPWFAAALTLKEEGFIPDDVEVSNEMTWEDVEPFYEEKVKNRAIEKAREELALEGFTEDELRFARMKSKGIDPAQFDVINRLKAVVDLKSQEDVSEEYKVAAIQSMYEFRGIPADEYQVLIKDAKSSEDETALNNLFNKSVTFHEENYEAFKVREQQQHQEYVNALKQQKKENEQRIAKIFKERKAGAFEFTDQQAQELKRAIYDKTLETKGPNGNKVAISEIENFLHNFNSNDELKIELFLLHKYKDDIKKQSTRKAKRNIEKELIAASKGEPVVEKEQEDNNEDNGGYRLPQGRVVIR